VIERNCKRQPGCSSERAGCALGILDGACLSSHVKPIHKVSALGFIKKLIGQKSKATTDPLAELALDPTRNDDFLRTLVRSHIWIMEQGKAMGTETPTQGEAMEHIKRGMEELDAVQSADQIQVYLHTVEGQAILPFFSSPDFFQGFVQTLRMDRITGFGGLSVPFTYLLNQQFAKNHFVLNPNTTAQRHITVEDRRRLMELAQHDDTAA